MATDSSGIIINETAAKFLGLTDPLNKPLYKSNGGEKSLANSVKYHIIGVVKDFNFSSLRDVVNPVVLILGQNTGALSIKMKAGNIPQLMAQIKDKWKGLSPAVQMNFSFMTRILTHCTAGATYRRNIHRVTTLAIIISCLGLFAWLLTPPNNAPKK